jgi:hypothetical protein
MPGVPLSFVACLAAVDKRSKAHDMFPLLESEVRMAVAKTFVQFVVVLQ